jgi:hypothetical protein
MATAGCSQWEAFEQDLADALSTCEAPGLQPRRSALGFFPPPQPASHLAAAARALSADAAPAVLSALLEECRRGGARHLMLKKTGAWEDMEVVGVAEEEAPLGCSKRCGSKGTSSRSVSSKGSPSRGDALAWQLPGRGRVMSTDTFPCSAAAGLTNSDDDSIEVGTKPCPSTATDRPHSWSPNSGHFPAVSSSSRQAARPPRDLPSGQRHVGRASSISPLVDSHSLIMQHSDVNDVSRGRGTSPRRGNSLPQDLDRTASRTGAMASVAAVAAAAMTAARTSAAGRAWTGAQRIPLRPHSSDFVLDILPSSRTGARRGSFDSAACCASAPMLAKLERHTVTSPFCASSAPLTNAEVPECAICMESFVDGELIRTLPCCHRFHACCVDPWLINRWQCPLCKFEVATR